MLTKWVINVFVLYGILCDLIVFLNAYIKRLICLDVCLYTYVLYIFSIYSICCVAFEKYLYHIVFITALAP